MKGTVRCNLCLLVNDSIDCIDTNSGDLPVAMNDELRQVLGCWLFLELAWVQLWIGMIFLVGWVADACDNTVPGILLAWTSVDKYRLLHCRDWLGGMD